MLAFVEEEILYKPISEKGINLLPEISFLARLRMYTNLWRALGFLHENKIAHRDLHSLNVLYNIKPEGKTESKLRAKIIDYDLMLHKDEYGKKDDFIKDK